MSSAPRDEGSATVLALAALIVLLTIAGVFATAGRATLLRQRAAAGADFAALAGAAQAGDPAARCRRAATLADANGTRLVACAASGEELTVTVRQPLPVALGRGRSLEASARAGPSARSPTTRSPATGLLDTPADAPRLATR